MLRTLLLIAVLGAGISAPGCAAGGQPETTTRRLPRSGWVFDVPSDAPLWVQRMDLREWDVTLHSFDDRGVPPFSRQTPFFRQDFRALPQLGFVFTHGPSASLMYTSALGSRELQRLIRIPHRPNEVYRVVPRHSPARYLVDLADHEVHEVFRRRLGDRFPLDRVTVLPDVAVQFARTPADALFDQIIATLRLD